MSDAGSNVEVEGSPNRVEVVGGGTPSPEQLAAVVVALTPVTAAHVEADAPTPAVAPAWARAALLESVGERRIAAPAQLRQPGER